jgi:hypothetical protein
MLHLGEGGGHERTGEGEPDDEHALDELSFSVPHYFE